MALQQIGERLTGEWLKKAGADGQAVIDAYKNRQSDVTPRPAPEIGGGPAVFRRAPLTHQPACKPGSVGRGPQALA